MKERIKNFLLTFTIFLTYVGFVVLSSHSTNAIFHFLSDWNLFSGCIELCLHISALHRQSHWIKR